MLLNMSNYMAITTCWLFLYYAALNVFSFITHLASIFSGYINPFKFIKVKRCAIQEAEEEIHIIPKPQVYFRFYLYTGVCVM